jgi:hypothetical protein
LVEFARKAKRDYCSCIAGEEYAVTSTQQTTVISDDMRSVVGSELARSVSFPVSESDIRKWAIAVYYPQEPPRRFWDAEAAAKSRYGGIVAPEDFNPFAWMAAEPQGVEGGASAAAANPDMVEESLGIKGPGLQNLLNGGLAVQYFEPIRPGDVITTVTRLGEYSERPGSLGLMLFTPRESTWTNQRGEVVKTSRMTLIRY